MACASKNNICLTSAADHASGVGSHGLCMQWWNPTIEEQAIDRAHRIGQTRTVHVTRITIAGTNLAATGDYGSVSKLVAAC